MASNQNTVDFIMDQISGVVGASSKKMFGEYAIFCEGRMVALICADELFIRKTTGGQAFVGQIEEKPPYPGAKPYFLVSGDRWDDSAWLSQLIRISTAELPLPKKKSVTKKSKVENRP